MATKPRRPRTPKEKEGAKKYNAKPKQVRARVERNKARREENAKRKKAGKPPLRSDQHVHHAGSHARGKTKVVSAKKNLSATKCDAACRRKKAAGGRKSKPNTVKRK